MIEKVAHHFLDRLVSEQVSRDTTFNRPGDFAENALIEHLYRYWLESTLASIGFTQIQREIMYPNKKLGRGQKSACDLVCRFSDESNWIELKVAYKDTGYTDSELLSDFEKLESIRNATKWYITVFITPDIKPCRKMTILEERAEKLGAVTKTASHQIPTPWKSWKNPHIHVTCHQWRA
jgi:hypothetical protein